MDLQELISRGRFVFAGAGERLKLFALVDGRKTAREIAKLTRRHANNVHRDLRQLSDVGLIQERRIEGVIQKKDGFTLYEKTPLARAVRLSYFSGPTKILKSKITASPSRAKGKRPRPLSLPSETEILDMCKKGEDQTLEFKSAGTDVRKVTKEIAAMLNTRDGGRIFYGVDDDGTIQVSDVSRQKFDQPLQNSVKNSIAPAATVALKSVTVVGLEVLVIIVPPWNRKDIYHFDEKVLVRKGTNIFGAKPEESRKLHNGQYVV
jgi:predicted HTH transcriptional regulator